ncbi:hypothetical protein ANN_17262 [Periplaneta americana]|uniref:Transposase n=1 Tax=Periplaneta americana TaxID=6978 RepID=A0ABQ8SSG3_PERAM|nr:hypothetical protein ANN_17262 [Periplaneta americana]
MARGRSAQECFQGLREACGDAALPYRTMARWVKAFREGRDAVHDNLRTGRPRVEDNTVQLLVSMLDADRRWTAHELAAEVGGVGYPMKFQRFNNGTAMQSHRPCWTGTKGKMTTFLDESSLWTKPGLAHTNQPNLKRQSNEWKHPGSSRPKKVRPTQSAVKVMFIVAYDTDGVILHHAVPPRQTANADCYCRFLQHHLRPVLRRKRRYLVVQNPIILNDNARIHTAAAVKDLLRRWQWEILEHPPYSPDMSPCDYELFTKGGQYGTSIKMDALMVYDTFQKFGKSIRRPEFECSGPQLEGPEFECSGPQLEGPEFEYSELSLKNRDIIDNGEPTADPASHRGNESRNERRNEQAHQGRPFRRQKTISSVVKSRRGELLDKTSEVMEKHAEKNKHILTLMDRHAEENKQKRVGGSPG